MKGWEGTYSFGCDGKTCCQLLEDWFYRYLCRHSLSDFWNVKFPSDNNSGLPDLMLSFEFSQQCCWIFKSAGMLYYVIECVVPTCPMIQHYVPENFIFINWACWMEFHSCLSCIIMIWNVAGQHFPCLVIQGGAVFIHCFDLQRSVVDPGRAWN
jgi:hypothetical protein